MKQFKLLVMIIAMLLIASCTWWKSGPHIHNTNAGNVGIGTGTIPPSEKLSVNGVIESKSGGIKFPDGSVQSTAAVPMPRNLISVRTSEFSVGPGQLQQRSVGCETNELATGGGIRTEDDPSLNIWINAPRLDASGWGVGISNYGSATRSVKVFAVCIRVQ